MVIYDFEDKDMKNVVWEMSNRIKDVEDKVNRMSGLEDRVRLLQKLVCELEDKGLISPEFEDEE